MLRRRSFRYGGREFKLRRGVFDPKRHLSGVAFADALGEAMSELLGDLFDGARVWDLGTGSGILGWQSARLGARVVATDLSATAVRTATENCAERDVDVRLGDMFEPVRGEWFDLVIVNPPYEHGCADSDADAAFVSPDFLERFGAEIGEYTDLVLLGFPADDQPALERTCLDLQLWRRIETSGDDLGLFVWRSDIDRRAR